jgi:hypothetical protein
MFVSRLLGGAAALILASSPVLAGAADVAGQKLDSGLGSLPHYSQWTDKSGRVATPHRVAGESIDDGLGGLPHYRYWTDKSGREPVRVLAAR